MLIPPDKKTADGPAAVSTHANSQQDLHQRQYAQAGADLEAGRYQQQQQQGSYAYSEGNASYGAPALTSADERQRLLSPSSAGASNAAAPPSYDDYLSARAQQQQQPPKPMTDPSYLGGPSRGNYRTSVFRRFMLASCFALVFLISLGAIFGFLGELAKIMGGQHGSGHGRGGPGGIANGRGDGSWKDIPGSKEGWKGQWDSKWSSEQPLLPIEVDPRNCDLWSEPVRLHEPLERSYIYGTRASFRLPFSALEKHAAFVHFRDGNTISGGHLKLEARGSESMTADVGNTELGPAGGDHKSNSFSSPTIHVLVEAYYRDPRDFYGTHICEAGADGNAGVVLMNSFADKIREQDQDLIGKDYRGPRYHVYVTLPRDVKSSHANSAMAVNDLELQTTNMGTAFVGDLASMFDFQDVSVKGSNAGIEFDSLATTTLLAGTSNGPIHAERLYVADVAHLRSSNAPISCGDVCTSGTNNDRGTTPRKIVIETSNGGISCDRACATESILLTTSSGSIGGSFNAPRVEGKTSNGKISGSFTGIRGVDHKGGVAANNGLFLKSSNGPMDVAIDVGDGKSRGPIRHTPVAKTESVRLDLSTSNGNLKAKLRELPADIEIDLGVKSSNSGIELIGDSHFQGEFSLQTSGSSKVDFVKLDSMSEEPDRDLELNAGGSKSRSSSSWPWDGDNNGGIKGSAKGTLVRQGEEKDGKHVWSKIRANTSNARIRAEL